MTVFAHKEFDDHERVVHGYDLKTGLRAIIAIHNSFRGPGVGGCRMWPYESDEKALTDVLRLSRGMTYKNALAGIPMGGGKCVIIGDSRRHKSADLMTSLGRFVDSLGGAYTIAEDVGISVADLEVAEKITPYVSGTPKGGSGNPAPATAFGCYHGIRAAAKARFGSDDLSNLSVALQGLGSVGYDLCRYLDRDGAKLVVADINKDSVVKAVQEFNATEADPQQIHAARVDIFSPCALGAVINDRTVGEITAPIIAGAANNQLERLEHGQMLHDKGILYAPDYAINAGGIINISFEKLHRGAPYNKEKAYARIKLIYETLSEIFERSASQNQPTSLVADIMAEERFGRREKAMA